VDAVLAALAAGASVREASRATGMSPSVAAKMARREYECLVDTPNRGVEGYAGDLLRTVELKCPGCGRMSRPVRRSSLCLACDLEDAGFRAVGSDEDGGLGCNVGLKDGEAARYEGLAATKPPAREPAAARDMLSEGRRTIARAFLVDGRWWNGRM